MARDVVALLDYIGWNERRGVHVVGVSLGMFPSVVKFTCDADGLWARWYDCTRSAF